MLNHCSLARLADPSASESTTLPRAFATTLIALLCAAPALAQQSRLYTNADLGRPLGLARPAPADAARLLEPYQFVPIPEPPNEAQIVILGSDPTEGPFGPFRRFSHARRLDGSLWSDPPWQSITYLPYDFRGTGYWRSRSDRREHRSPEGARTRQAPARSR